MATSAELTRTGAPGEGILKTINVEPGEPLLFKRVSGERGRLGEISYEVVNVDDDATAIEYNFPPPEPGKLPQGSKPDVFIDDSRELSGIVYEIDGTLQEVVARITDVFTPSEIPFDS